MAALHVPRAGRRSSLESPASPRKAAGSAPFLRAICVIGVETRLLASLFAALVADQIMVNDRAAWAGRGGIAAAHAGPWQLSRSRPRTTWVTPWPAFVMHHGEVIARRDLLAHDHRIAPARRIGGNARNIALPVEARVSEPPPVRFRAASASAFAMSIAQRERLPGLDSRLRLRGIELGAKARIERRAIRIARGRRPGLGFAGGDGLRDLLAGRKAGNRRHSPASRRRRASKAGGKSSKWLRIAADGFVETKARARRLSRMIAASYFGPAAGGCRYPRCAGSAARPKRLSENRIEEGGIGVAPDQKPVRARGEAKKGLRHARGPSIVRAFANSISQSGGG